MSECREYQEKISAMLDGELADAEWDALMAHIGTCPECRALYNAFSAVSDAVREDTIPAPRNLHASVMEAVRREAKKEKRAHAVRYLRRYGAMAAAFVLIVAAALAARTALPFGKSAETQAPAAAGAASVSVAMQSSAAKSAAGAAEDRMEYATTTMDAAAAESVTENAVTFAAPESAPVPEPEAEEASEETPAETVEQEAADSKSVLDALELDVKESELTTRKGNETVSETLSAADTRVFLHALLMGEKLPYEDNRDAYDVDYTLDITPEEGEDYTLRLFYRDGELCASWDGDSEAVPMDRTDALDSFNRFMQEHDQ